MCPLLLRSHRLNVTRDERGRAGAFAPAGEGAGADLQRGCRAAVSSVAVGRGGGECGFGCEERCSAVLKPVRC